MFSPTQKRSRGFTLIELMVVITIIGLLASAVLAGLASARSKARDAQRIQAVKELQKALELYRNGNGGNYPCSTAMPACTSGGNQVNVNGSASSTIFNAVINTYLTLPQEVFTFSSNPTWGSIVYRTGGTTASPVRHSYTIMVRREADMVNGSGTNIPAGTFCGIRVGTSPNTADWPVGTYPDCF